MGLPKLAAPMAERAPLEHPARLGTAVLPDGAWRVLTGIGFALALVGGTDLILLWYPFAFQNPEWEFGTVTGMLDSMPALAVGLGLVLAGSLALGVRWATRTAMVLFGLLGVVVVAGALLYATNIPLALGASGDPSVQIGLFKAMAKSAIQAIVYASVFLWIAFSAWQ